MIPDAKIDNELLWRIFDILVTLLSFFGSFLMSYYCLRLYSPSTSTKFILATAIADFLYSIANILSNFESKTNPLLCQTEAMIRSASMFLSILFTTCAAIVSAKASLSQNIYNSNRFLKYTLLIGISYGICLALGPYFFPNHVAYTYGPLFCWVSSKSSVNEESKKLLIFMLDQGVPVILATLITLIGYLNVIRKMRSLPKSFLEQMDVSLYQVLWYPIVLFITFVPIVVENIIRIYEPDRPMWKKALTLTFTHAIGFINALVYIIQRKLYYNVKPKSRPLSMLAIQSKTTTECLLLNESQENEI